MRAVVALRAAGSVLERSAIVQVLLRADGDENDCDGEAAAGAAAAAAAAACLLVSVSCTNVKMLKANLPSRDVNTCWCCCWR